MFKLKQQGMSLPIVLGATALILANTYYFLQLDKVASKRSSLAAAQISEQTERGRIGSVLSDLKTCSSTDNFGGKVLSSLVAPALPGAFTIPFSLKKNSDSFLAVGSTYAKNTHQVTNFYLQDDLSIADPEFKYSLVIIYNLINSSFTPKKTAMIKIPLFISTSGGIISKCYARPLQDTTANTTLSLATEASCRGSVNSPTFFTSTATLKECKNNVQTAACVGGQVVNGVSINNVTPLVSGEEMMLSFTCSGMVNACSSSPVQTIATKITNSSLTCNAPIANACSGGSMLIKNSSSNTFSCSTSCAATKIHNSMTVSGTPNCYDRLYPCPTGMYVKTLNANGTHTCEYITYRNRDCGAGKYAKDLNNTNAADPLVCTAYTKTQTCSGTYNYASSFTTTPAITCRQF